MLDLVLAESKKLLIVAREFIEEEINYTVIAICVKTGERKWREHTSVVFNGFVEKMKVAISENETLVLIGSPLEKTIKAVELEFEKNSAINSVVTTFEVIDSFKQNFTISPDGNSFSTKNFRYDRTQGSHRWIRS